MYSTDYPETKEHQLDCSTPLETNKIVSYIPNYIDIFNDNDIREQEYIASLMIENLKRKKIIEGI